MHRACKQRTCSCNFWRTDFITAFRPMVSRPAEVTSLLLNCKCICSNWFFMAPSMMPASCEHSQCPSLHTVTRFVCGHVMFACSVLASAWSWGYTSYSMISDRNTLSTHRQLNSCIPVLCGIQTKRSGMNKLSEAPICLLPTRFSLARSLWHAAIFRLKKF